MLLLQEFDLKIIDKKGSENHVADHLSRLANEEVTARESEVIDEFPDEKLLVVQERPWFTDIANFKAVGIIPETMDWHQRRKLLKDLNQYIWDDPYLFKMGANNLLRSCVTSKEPQNILWHCHNSPYARHFNGERTAAKVLQLGFFWPTLFKDAHMHVQHCDSCQRTGNISRRHEMPLRNIEEIEVFDCWGIDFIGPLPRSFMNEYILLVVEYISRWVQAIPTQKADAKTVIKFLMKHILQVWNTKSGDQ